MSAAEPREEYEYLMVPPSEKLRSCVGLVLAGMAARAKIGVGGLEEAVELLESFHSEEAPTRFRFSLRDEGIVAEVQERPSSGEICASRWRTVVELVS